MKDIFLNKEGFKATLTHSDNQRCTLSIENLNEWEYLLVCKYSSFHKIKFIDPSSKKEIPIRQAPGSAVDIRWIDEADWVVLAPYESISFNFYIYKDIQKMRNVEAVLKCFVKNPTPHIPKHFQYLRKY